MRCSTRLCLFVVVLMVVGVCSSTASAETLSPWWHLFSATQPSYVQPGTAKQQVWKVTVPAEKGQFGLEVGPYGSVVVVAGEPRAELQANIESVLRGEYFPDTGRIVEVTAKSGQYNKYEEYEIKLVGELEYTHYFELYTGTPGEFPESLERGGKPVQEEIQQTSRGRSDGVIVLTATNLGDAQTAVDCVKVTPGTGHYADSACTEVTNGAVGNFEAKAGEPVTLTDKLPSGLEAVQIEGSVGENFLESGTNRDQIGCSLKEASCTFVGGERVSANSKLHFALAPYEQIKVEIAVNVTGAKSGAVNEASVTGGGAPSASARQALTISDVPVPFGTSTLEMRPEEAGGALAAQAGAHPFQLTTTWGANIEGVEGHPAGGQAKDLHFNLPPGLVGNPTPFTRCTIAQFLTQTNEGEGTACPLASVIGVARSVIRLKTGWSPFLQETTLIAPIYNLEPGVGEPARFGFVTAGEPVELDTSIRTGGDYGVTVSVRNITQLIEFVSSEVTFWGVPGASAHNRSRGEACLVEAQNASKAQGSISACRGFSQVHPPPLLTLGTSCPNGSSSEGEPLHTTVEGDSWEDPQDLLAPVLNTAPMPSLDGCNRLPFAPQIKVTPDGSEASKPTGLTVDVHVPQEGQLNPEGLAQSNIENIEVTLPAGVTLNPSAADGLQACSEQLVGYQGSKEYPTSPAGQGYPLFSPYLPASTAALAAGDTESLQPGVNFCPDASKIAEATIKTPLLPNPVKGFVYLASPQNFDVFPPENPFGTRVAMYIVAEDPASGSLVKLPGSVSLNESTGQISSTFAENPQLPFEDAELHFFGGERAPLTSPSHCGTYTTQATYTPWDGGPATHSSSGFQITSGPNDTPCPGASLPFNPSLSSGTTNINANSFTPLTTTLSRPDGNQNIQSVKLHYPPGVSGLLTGVKLCGEAQANAGTCGPESQIGVTIVSVGLGGDPFTVTGGKVYITEKYAGAPFGLSIVNPAKAGPFDLQEGRPVVVRAKVEVDPTTAALTVTTDSSGPHAIPTIIEGFALQIQHVNVLINRPSFTFNPTNCSAMQVTGAINSNEGASSPVSVPFQVTNCAALPFSPRLTASTSGKTSRASGASLHVKLVAGVAGEANIHSVKVDLPKQLPSRLTTLQKACLAKTFEANPANCPAASIVAHAKAVTPLIPVPLEGPAYFVSYGGAKFPELVIVLQGYGVTIDLHGETFINKAGITSSTFRTVPDAPVGSFEITLPEGKYSALAANGNLCKSKLAMPTAIIAQNGAQIHKTTPITVTGCPRHKAKKAKKAKARRRSP